MTGRRSAGPSKSSAGADAGRVDSRSGRARRCWATPRRRTRRSTSADQEGDRPAGWPLGRRSSSCRNGAAPSATWTAPAARSSTASASCPAGRTAPGRRRDPARRRPAPGRRGGMTARRPRPTARPAVLFTLVGTTCRSWDDFLAASAQRWERSAGRADLGPARGLPRSIGRADLAPSAPRPGARRTARRLAGLRRPRSPPGPSWTSIRNRSRFASASGSTTERVVSTNTGYRILRGSARVEPATEAWVQVEPSGPFAVVDELALRVRGSRPRR